MWPEASWKVRCSTPVDPVDPEICPVILKMENIFLLMNSIIHLWKIPCSMSIVVDISFAIMCGVGLFYLLIPFLKEYPESPPPGREKNTPKVRKALTEIQWRSSPRTLISHSLERQVWNMDFFLNTEKQIFLNLSLFPWKTLFFIYKLSVCFFFNIFNFKQIH